MQSEGEPSSPCHGVQKLVCGFTDFSTLPNTIPLKGKMVKVLVSRDKKADGAALRKTGRKIVVMLLKIISRKTLMKI